MLLLLSVPLGAGSDEELPEASKTPAIPIDLLAFNTVAMNLKGNIKSITQSAVITNNPNVGPPGDIIYEFDEQGRLISSKTGGELLYRKTKYSYDNGKIICIDSTLYIEEKFGKEATTTFTLDYDAKSNLISRICKRGTLGRDETTCTSTLIRTRKGELIEEEGWSSDNRVRITTTALCADGTWLVISYDHQPDETAQNQHKSIFDKSYRLILSESETGTTKNKYDKDGNLVETITKASDGDPVKAGNQASIEVRTYEIVKTDAQGNWVEMIEEMDRKVETLEDTSYLTEHSRVIEYYE